jgi:UDPglucose--hexose-1-phosphate uridylyltransferase
VVHTPEHVLTLADLGDDQLDLVAEAWQRRRAALPDGYLHALINEGRRAGASLAHSHSQLVWLRDRPPAVAAERDLDPAGDAEPILERDGVVAVCPRAGRVPYEALIAPIDREVDPWTSDKLAAGLRALAEVVRRLHRVTGVVPLNAWLHAGPWWHIELFPRLTTLAGIELGAGIYVNTLAPEDAARALRNEKGRL